MAKVYSVSELNNYIKRLLEGDSVLRNVIVAGEISTFKQDYKGNMYFTLKDAAGAVVKCVMFRSKNSSLRFMPKTGDKVQAVGRVSIYPSSGDCQLYVDMLLLDGVGALAQAYEKLKQDLNNEGLFAASHKQELPLHPKAIGVVTSPTGAVIHDVIRVARKRNPGVKIFLYPVKVQGTEASKQVVEGIRFFNRTRLADVLIVGRGGGSMEDLWAFNEEPTVRAVYASRIPVISAVGHDTDFPLCDLAADKRAATPSQAAELAVIDLQSYADRIEVARRRLDSLLQGKLKNLVLRTENATQNGVMAHPELLYKHQEAALKRLLESRALMDSTLIYKRKEEKLERLLQSRALTDPTLIYSRKEEALERLLDSRVFKEPQLLWEEKENRTIIATEKLMHAMEVKIQQAEQEFKLKIAQLEAMSPLKVLSRGFSVTKNQAGKILTKAQETSWGEELVTELADGSIVSVVQEIRGNEDDH